MRYEDSESNLNLDYQFAIPSISDHRAKCERHKIDIVADNLPLVVSFYFPNKNIMGYISLDSIGGQSELYSRFDFCCCNKRVNNGIESP